jgi:predicted aspartyl protease
LISRRSLLSQFGLLAIGGAAAWWLRDNVLWPSPRVVLADGQDGSGWLPFSHREQGVVIVEALVNGAPVQVLVDSGAQTSVIDRGLAQRMQLPTAVAGPVVLAYGVSGGPQLGRAASIDLQLGAVSLQGLRAAVLDLAPISGASGRDFSLILGQDVLHALVADFDFPASRLAFHAPETYRLPDGAAPASARVRGREMLVPVTVETVSLEVVLDTGASAALALSSETAEAAGLLTGRRVGYAPSITFGGLSHDRVVRVKSFAFAGRSYGEVPVHIYEPSGARVPSGLLGVEALRPFRVILDTGRDRLHLVAPKPARRRT